MVDRLVNSEANARRITLVESCFGSAGQPLSVPGRVLVGEGVLTKMCRKKPKPRQFYLFNDLLVYGNIIINKKKYNKQHIIPLEEVKLQSLDDDGQFRNGWLICTRGKSFAVYAATATEKQEWMAHINKCIKDLLEKSGKKPSNEHAAVWVPDSEAVVCMVCTKSQFNVLNRRHHCRKCGAVVCGACSTRRYLLPSQSSKPIRVCDPCYEQLTETKTSNVPSSNANNVNTVIPAATTTVSTTEATTGIIKRRDSFSNLSTVVEVVEEAEEDSSVADLKSILSSKRESLRTQTKEPESLIPQNKEPELFKLQSEEPDSLITQTKEPESLISQNDAPQSLISALDNGPQSLFSQPDASMILPDAPTDVPPILIPAKNPKLYQLVQMSGESSFWWDSSESSDAGTSGLVQNFTTHESSMSDDAVADDARGTDSSGEDDSDDDEQNGNGSEEPNASIPKPNFYASPVSTNTEG